MTETSGRLEMARRIKAHLEKAWTELQHIPQDANLMRIVVQANDDVKSRIIHLVRQVDHELDNAIDATNADADARSFDGELDAMEPTN